MQANSASSTVRRVDVELMAASLKLNLLRETGAVDVRGVDRELDRRVLLCAREPIRWYIGTSRFS